MSFIPRHAPDFYSRPCGRGDSAFFSSAARYPVFLLTPLREGRLLPPVRVNGWVPISTHAPAGGATYAEAKKLPFIRISTHAPAGGATGHAVDLIRRVKAISTHAPAGGATGLPMARRGTPSHFYSRPCGRGDRSPSLPSTTKRKFLLTPLREGRQQFSTSPS